MRNFIVTCLLRIKGFRFNNGNFETIGKTSDGAAKVSFGAAGATWLLVNVFGISLVTHSSGGAILSASSGYVAGTYLTASAAAIIGGASFFLWFVAVPVGILLVFRKRIGATLISLGNLLSR